MNIPFGAYETVVGFECHVQLNTKSKLFSSGQNQFGALPNTLLHEVDAGLPGVLPLLNKKAVEFAIKLGLALSCQINLVSVFARKHYFYPDLPKGYQISQFDLPICEHGVLPFLFEGKECSVRIRRIHIEEDAGKNMHIEGQNMSFVDFNRAGTPLLEIVTEPDLRSPKESIAAFKALHQLVTFLGICDGNMQEGSMRADVNVSVKKIDAKELGTRTETKNLNSFRYLGQAIAFESRRQIIELESGHSIKQETRLWDPGAKESRSLRSKEEAQDYRYFADPDLLPLKISEDLIEKVKTDIPELPYHKYFRYQNDFGLTSFDAEVLTSNKLLSNYFEEAVSAHNNPKSIANWIINNVLRAAKLGQDSDETAVDLNLAIPSLSIANLVKLIDEKIISSNIAKKVFEILEADPKKSVHEIVDENQWKVVNNQDQIQGFVDQVFRENPLEIQKYREGKTKVFGFLMGQLMKISRGQLDPKSANDLMIEALKKSDK